MGDGTATGDDVEVTFRKYDGRPHRRAVERLLGTDRYGVWLGKPVGSVVQYFPSGAAVAAERPAVRLVPHDQWWTALFFPDPLPNEIYCDVTTPARWTGAADVTFVDLDLDVEKWRDGRVTLLDEDEFAEHRVRFGYSDEMVAAATAAAHQVFRRISAGDEPFGSHYRSWLDRV